MAFRREPSIAFALLCLVAALVLPPLPTARPVHRYQITFDVSQSMEVRDAVLDATPVSRLAFARAEAARLLRALPCGSRVGWSAFVERRTLTLVTPLEVCAHYDALLAALEGIDRRLRWGEASGVGRGLHQSLRAAHAIGEDTAVVLISDGQEAPPLAPGQSGFPKNEGLGVRGLVAGVGGTTAVPIPKTDVEGRVVGYFGADEVVQRSGVADSAEELSRRDDVHLASLARLAGLGYTPLVASGDLAAALERLGVAGEATVPTDYRHLPAALALAALCWRFRPRRPSPPRRAFRLDAHRRGGRLRGRLSTKAPTAARSRRSRRASRPPRSWRRVG